MRKQLAPEWTYASKDLGSGYWHDVQSEPYPELNYHVLRFDGADAQHKIDGGQDNRLAAAYRLTGWNVVAPPHCRV